MGDTYTVLIVDDEDDFLSSIRRALRKEDYRVIVASRGREALRLLAENDVSLVVSDYLMPEMDGIELAKKIHSGFPHIPILMLTALSEINIAMKAINEAGVCKFLLKPLDIVEFKAMLRSVLKSADLLSKRQDALSKVRRREAILLDLERQFPGITNVQRDENGYYLP